MGKSIIDAKGIDRVFEVFTGNVVVLRDLTVIGGNGGAQPAAAASVSGEVFQDAIGATGGPGQDGGGILSSGDLTLDRVSVQANTAGTGGAGALTTHSKGRAATGGAGGSGGRGGGIASSGQLRVVDSRIASNIAGTGGAGGSATGGSVPAAAGAHGANGTGGLGGAGGDGGGIYTRGALTVERSVIGSNRAGAGGVGGGGSGGEGADNTPPQPGGNGGAGNGGTGGHGGFGGGISVELNAGSASISDSAVTANSGGDGGIGSPSHGGNGGDGGGASFGTVYSPGAGGNAVGGAGGYGGSGGGIMGRTGDTTVTRTTVQGNAAGSGVVGGAATAGVSGVGGFSNSPVPGTATAGAGGDGGSGGGFQTAGSGTRTLTDSTVDSNRTGSGGPGNGTATGTNPTGGNGGGAGSGAGLDSHIAPLAIVRSTITANTIGTRGLGAGGGANGVTGTAGAIWSGAGTRLSGSIVAENQAQRCYGDIQDGGDNIDFPADPVCPGASVDPLLAPLADNGGVGQTRALSAASPVIDYLVCNPATDGRGVPRPVGSKCDAGAYEFALPVIASVSADAGETSAALSAKVTPYAGSATVTFDYGVDESYGSGPTKTVSGGVATPADVTLEIGGLQPGTTYHFRVRATSHAGTTTTTDRTFRTAAAPGGGGSGTTDPDDGDGGSVPPPNTPRDVTDPAIRSVKADPSRFLVGTKKTPVTARARATRAASGPAVGTKLKFALSEDADVEIAFERKTIGRKGTTRSGKKTCKFSRRRPEERSERCTRYVEAGTLTRDGERGGNSIAFSGKLGSRALPIGVYRFIVSASDTAGNDADPVTAKFTILDPDDD